MISFDLDMTLLDHKTGQITPSALKAVELLRKRHKIVLATGRDMDNYYSCRYRDILKPDGIVHMNGTKVTAGGTLLYEHTFDPALLKELLAYCDAQGFAIGVTVKDDDFYIHPEVVEESDRLHWGISGVKKKRTGRRMTATEILNSCVKRLMEIWEARAIRKALAIHGRRIRREVCSIIGHLPQI